MLLTIITFIIILGLLVLVHELGHFITARIFKTKVEEFGFGLPPRLIGFYQVKSPKGDHVTNKRNWIWGKKFKSEKAPHTIYSFNWIPVGGFVKIKGENESEIKDKDSFGSRKIWQRAIMLSAGVIMNVILCVVLLSIGFGIGIPSVLDDDILSQVKSVRDEKIQIVSISKDSPAESVGLTLGDAILALDNYKVISIENLQNYVHQHESQVVNLQVNRGGKILNMEIVPKVLATSNKRAVLGVGLVKTGIVTYPWYQSLWQGIKATYNLIVAILIALGSLLKNIILTGEVTTELAGPVGIAVLTGQVVNLGFVYVLQFAALLSLNLAIINFLPIPALDGGRIVFLIIEKVRGRVVNRKIENLVHNIGFAILMILIVLVTYRDLVRWGGQIWERIM